MAIMREGEGLRLPPDSLRRLRALAPTIVARASTRIQEQVPAYAGAAAGRRRRLIEMAITGAMLQYLDSVDPAARAPRRVDELFRQMGAGEAGDGHTLQPMQSAISLAVSTIWESLRDFAETEGLDPAVVCELGDVLFASTVPLMSLVAEGHRGATHLRERSPSLARERLVGALLRGATPDRVTRLASAAGWRVPDAVVAMALDTRALAADPGLPDTVLVRHRQGVADLVVDAEEAESVLAGLRRAVPGSRVALTWDVPLADAAAASTWAARALRLVETGVLPREAVVRCAEHRTHLWLHAEPVLRRGLCQDLLRPLLAETPNSREILSETLLVWLETRDSAPAIAQRLGVHPQTVRYRWKRINELFGETLHDPDLVVQLTLLLKASVPLWKAGDQSDFELFRREGADGE